MLTFLQQVPQRNGMGYLYSYEGMTAMEVGQAIIDNADAPFVFQGKVQDQRHEIHPMYIESTIDRPGGQVAGSAIINGNNAVVTFHNGNRVMIALPPMCTQADADQLVGMTFSGDAYDDFGGYGDFEDDFSDDESFDDDDDFNEGFSDDEGEIEDEFESDDYGSIPTGMGEMNAPGIDPRMAMSAAQNGEPVKLGEWLLTLILLMIPVVNIVVLILWLVSKKTKPSKKNYLKAYLILVIVGIVLGVIGSFVALQMGILTLTGSIGQPSQPAITEVEGDGDEADDEDESSDNANASSNSNEASSNKNSNDTAFEKVDNLATDKVSIEQIVKEETMSGEKIAIVSAKIRNWTDQMASPNDLTYTTAMQGQNNLQMHTAGTSVYNPAKFDEKIAPGAETIFQIAFKMVDDQDVHVILFDEADHTVKVAETAKKLT